MTPTDRFEAKLLVSELLAKMEEPSIIVRALHAQYGKRITDRMIETFLHEVRKDWKTQADVAKPERRQAYLQAIRRLFMKADEAGDLRMCLRAVALMAKIDGMEIIPKETGITVPDDDFDNRTENELEFYGDHGHWPEDDAVAGDPEEGSTVH